MSIYNLSSKDIKADIAFCPFCGGSAELQNTWTPSYWVECIDCEAQVHDPDSAWVRCDAEMKSKHTASAKRAVKAWNKRV